ncbi:cytochrome P450 97B2, chloroplastic-like protein [Corchorus olitorius]|uniref:Cytochrome P450 97B2, chloroplastic-like protein n=1 Tax=Corchorus olitorius TaxID=93759 RepID=A0A1R3L011_9ROSI|nr:cytochrome P450 97B2, chloroplastic-like protein [Corchorus olitorius]
MGKGLIPIDLDTLKQRRRGNVHPVASQIGAQLCE